MDRKMGNKNKINTLDTEKCENISNLCLNEINSVTINFQVIRNSQNTAYVNRSTKL